MILFVHGLGSCGWGEKSLALRRQFGLAGVLAPDLPFPPRQAVAHLLDLLRRYPVRALVGSSLGGFYATAVNATRRVPAVLINPVVRPHRLLAAHLGTQRRWCDDAPFTIDRDYLEALASLQRPQTTADERYLVLLAEADEVLDWRDAAAYYQSHEVRGFPGGDHRFSDLPRFVPLIDDWLADNA